LLAVTADAVADLVDAGQGLDVDVEQVAGPPLPAALHRFPGLVVAEGSETKRAEDAGGG